MHLETNWICLLWNPDKQSTKNQPGLELKIYIESENVILQWFNVYGAFMVFSCMFLVAQSCLALSDPMDCSQSGSSIHGDSPGKNTEVGCYVLLQGIFPTQGLNPGLHLCRQIIYCLSHQGSLRILARVAYPFCRGNSQHRNWTRVSCIAGGFLTSSACKGSLCSYIV